MKSNIGRQVMTLMSFSLLAISAVALAKSVLTTKGYDPDESKARLAQIGRALQLYRQESGIKPVTEWEVPADAGLPPSLITLAMPGHKWSLAEGLETFKLTSLTRHVPNSISDFANLYLMPEIELKPGDPYETFGSLMRSRGEKLPIMADYNFGQDEAHRTLLPRRFAIVLRINGKVEIVEHRSDSMDIFVR